MTRPRFLPSARSLTKWSACLLILLTPGSFFVLPALWLVHHWNRANAPLSQPVTPEPGEKL